VRRLNADPLVSDVQDSDLLRLRDLLQNQIDLIDAEIDALVLIDVDFEARIAALEGGGGGGGLTQAVIDFGSTAVREKVFTITDAGVVAPTYKVVVKMAYTGEDSENPGVDETILLAAQAGTGQFTLFARVASNDAVRGQFTINYQVAA